MNRVKKCCFTGHRPQNLPFRFREEDERCLRLKEVLRIEIEKQISENQVLYFITGMALGVDQWAAETILELRKQYPQLYLEAAIPCDTQAAKWSEKSKERYHRILSCCDKITTLQKEYTKDCMEKRNRYMVDCSDAVIAVWDGTPSGTGKTVTYAKSQGKLLITINPQNCETISN
jgi:uncharacterized phage-like protein YoqJ